VLRYNSPDCPVPQGRATLNSPASGICSAIIHRTCPVSQRSNGYISANGHLQRHLMRASAQKSGMRKTAHQTVYSTCSVHHRTARRPHQLELQRSNPNGWVTWLAHRTLSGAPCDSSLHQTASLVVGAINTPNHPSVKSSKFSTFQLLTRALAFNSRHTKVIKSSPIPHKALVISERDLLCSFELLRLDCFLLSFFLANNSIVIEARDTNCVVVLAGKFVPG
jgi:hypothetical protein